MAIRTEVTTRALTGTIGAEVHNVDLASLEDDDFRVITDLLDQHLVLAFRDQQLTRQQHRDFGSRFGELYIHPNFPGDETVPEVFAFTVEPQDEPPKGEAKDKDVGGYSSDEQQTYSDRSSLRWDSYGMWKALGANVWHSDVSFEQQPAMGSILYCRDAPDAGGDTMWSNQYLAYETLSQGMKQLLDGLVAVHSDEFQRAEREAREGGPISWPTPPKRAEHPVIRTNSKTGRKALYVSEYFTDRIKGMSVEESSSILSFLYQRSVQPEFCCRIRWETGTVVFWDNRWTMHYAIDDYRGQRREMNRITIIGETPV